MLSGQLYDPLDPELVRAQCQRPCGVDETTGTPIALSSGTMTSSVRRPHDIRIASGLPAAACASTPPGFIPPALAGDLEGLLARVRPKMRACSVSWGAPFLPTPPARLTSLPL